MQSQPVQPSPRVLDGSDGGFRYAPLVPNLGSIDFPPQANLHSATTGNKERSLQGKENREPADHVWSVCCWHNAEGDVLVQSSLKEAAKPVHDTVKQNSKGESGKAFIINGSAVVGMTEGEARLRFC